MSPFCFSQPAPCIRKICFSLEKRQRGTIPVRDKCRRQSDPTINKSPFQQGKALYVGVSWYSPQKTTAAAERQIPRRHSGRRPYQPRRWQFAHERPPEPGQPGLGAARRTRELDPDRCQQQSSDPRERRRAGQAGLHGYRTGGHRCASARGQVNLWQRSPETSAGRQHASSAAGPVPAVVITGR